MLLYSLYFGFIFLHSDYLLMYNVPLGCLPIFLQALVEQARGLLETIDGVTTVHGRFYELCSNYHKVSVEGFCS